MTWELLGNHFGLRGGGSDLMFPRHDNEMARCTCAHAGDYVTHGMHPGIVMVDSAQRWKSLGNVIRA